MTPAKSEKTVALTGVKKDGQSARIGCEVRQFQNDRGSIVVKKLPNGNISLLTRKGQYELVKHPKFNQYHGVCAGVKTRLTYKKVSARLTYWA